MRKITHKRTMALIAAGLLLPALAGCSRSEPEEQPVTTVENDAGVEEIAPDDNVPAMANEAEAVPTNMAEETPPPPPVERTADQQMMDDASVTGMTARVQRAPADAPAAEETPKDGQ